MGWLLTCWLAQLIRDPIPTLYTSRVSFALRSAHSFVKFLSHNVRDGYAEYETDDSSNARTRASEVVMARKIAADRTVESDAKRVILYKK